MHGACASPATARASSVSPVPGGRSDSRTPCGLWPPSRRTCPACAGSRPPPTAPPSPRRCRPVREGAPCHRPAYRRARERAERTQPFCTPEAHETAARRRESSAKPISTLSPTARPSSNGARASARALAPPVRERGDLRGASTTSSPPVALRLPETCPGWPCPSRCSRPRRPLLTCCRKYGLYGTRARDCACVDPRAGPVVDRQQRQQNADPPPAETPSRRRSGGGRRSRRARRLPRIRAHRGTIPASSYENCPTRPTRYETGRPISRAIAASAASRFSSGG